MESAEEDNKFSSDLEDCQELWVAELGNYVIETHKRQKQVDAWFSRWIIVRLYACLTGDSTQLTSSTTGARFDHCIPYVSPL